MVSRGLITKDQLAVAEVTQRALGGDLTHVLIKKGFIEEQAALNFFGERLNLQVVDLKRSPPNHSLARMIPYQLVQKFKTIPFKQAGKVLTLAIADPFSLPQLASELSCEGFELDFVIAPHQQIETAIQKNYLVHKLGGHWSSHVEVIGAEKKAPTDAKDSAKVEELASALGTVAAVDSILESAYTDHASDIHIEPQENFIRVRLRIDGMLEEKHVLPLKMHLPIVSRIKIISGINIAERRAPQDGRFSVKIQGRLLDCRTSTYPTIHGEKVVIRLFTKGDFKKLEQLGMSPKDRETFKSWILKPHGLIFVTGPTGSGKSTTLYAALQLLNSIERNIMSIEDPVENEIVGISQAQLNPKANVTFASALKSMLRQDPDVIMVGEVRDAETAEMALRAALTGHLVLSTLHTNTALGAVSRLINLGIPPFLVSSALIGSLGQRLVRKNCEQCRVEYQDTEGEGKMIGLTASDKLFRGAGCEACRFTGFTSRIGIFELLTISAGLRALIEKGAPEELLGAELRSSAFMPMMEDGRSKILQGLTTLREVLKVTEAE